VTWVTGGRFFPPLRKRFTTVLVGWTAVRTCKNHARTHTCIVYKCGRGTRNTVWRYAGWNSWLKCWRRRYVKFVCPGWIIDSAHESKLLNSLWRNIVSLVCSEICLLCGGCRTDRFIEQADKFICASWKATMHCTTVRCTQFVYFCCGRKVYGHHLRARHCLSTCRPVPILEIPIWRV
jgi:hypothetical protein